MAIKTCAVTITVRENNGQPAVNAVVAARLSDDVLYQGFVVPREVKVFTDSNGKAVLNLFPTALIAEGSPFYSVVVVTPGGYEEKFFIHVPNTDTANMRDLIISGGDIPPEAEDALRKLYDEIKIIRAEVAANAEAAKNSAATAAQSAAEATVALQNTQTEHTAITNEIGDAKTELTILKTDTETAAREAETAKTQAEDSVTDANQVLTVVEQKEQHVEHISNNVDASQAHIDNIYQQILDAIAQAGGGAGVNHVVIEAHYQYNAAANQTLFTGADLNGHNLAYELGNILVFRNGLLLRPHADYNANDKTSIELTKPAHFNDSITILSCTTHGGGGGGGGGDVDLTPIYNELALKYSATNPPVIDDVTGLAPALDDKYSDSNPPAVNAVTGLQAALDSKYSTQNPPAVNAVTGLQAELDSKYSAQNPPPGITSEADIDYTKIPHLEDVVDSKFSPDNLPTIDDTPGLRAQLNSKFSPDNLPTIDDTVGLRPQLNSKVNVGDTIAIADGGTGATTEAAARTNLDVYNKIESTNAAVTATSPFAADFNAVTLPTTYDRIRMASQRGMESRSYIEFYYLYKHIGATPPLSYVSIQFTPPPEGGRNPDLFQSLYQEAFVVGYQDPDRTTAFSDLRIVTREEMRVELIIVGSGGKGAAHTADRGSGYGFGGGGGGMLVMRVDLGSGQDIIIKYVTGGFTATINDLRGRYEVAVGGGDDGNDTSRSGFGGKVTWTGQPPLAEKFRQVDGGNGGGVVDGDKRFNGGGGGGASGGGHADTRSSNGRIGGNGGSGFGGGGGGGGDDSFRGMGGGSAAFPLYTTDPVGLSGEKLVAGRGAFPGGGGGASGDDTMALGGPGAVIVKPIAWI